MNKRTAFLPASVVVFAGGLSTLAQTPGESADRYQWLEDVSGERSMAW